MNHYTHSDYTNEEKRELVEQGFCPDCGGQLTTETQYLGEAGGMPTEEIIIVCTQCGGESNG